MTGFKAGRSGGWRGQLAVLSAVILTGALTHSAAADPGKSGDKSIPRRRVQLVQAPANLIVIAQVQTPAPAKKESWLKKAWRNRRQRPWFFVAGGVVLVLLVIGGWYLVGGGKQKGPKLQVTENQIGPYQLKNLLATGHTSQVWEVVESSSHLHFAMKLLLPENVHNPVHRQLLFHEAEVGRLLAHPNIIKIKTVMKDPEHPFFIMEFFPSGSLKMRIMRKEKAFIQEKVHDIFKQTMTGLAYMHASGWVHRDIKPENILVNSAGEVRIIDFAITERIPKGMSKTFHRRAKSAQGTRSYMPPEQIRGQALDGRTDIYSFAAAAYEVVTGRPPFRGGSPEALLNKHLYEKPVSPEVYNPEVTKEFGEFILRMLSKRREERPNNFHEALMQFRNIKVFKTPAVKKEEAK
ncbi:MAG TPA: serine/threonine-protein kinase [Gemmataceae bacterium]|jgi:serine/threonine-protein kinase|nr:serine/threonine-protein kinase [Gemmataceae bacterium]